MNHWDTQAVHLTIEGSLWFVSNSCSLFFLLFLLLFQDRTALLVSYFVSGNCEYQFPAVLFEHFPAIVNRLF